MMSTTVASSSSTGNDFWPTIIFGGLVNLQSDNGVASDIFHSREKDITLTFPEQCEPN